MQPYDVCRAIRSSVQATAQATINITTTQSAVTFCSTLRILTLSFVTSAPSRPNLLTTLTLTIKITTKPPRTAASAAPIQSLKRFALSNRSSLWRICSKFWLLLDCADNSPISAETIANSIGSTISAIKFRFINHLSLSTQELTRMARGTRVPTNLSGSLIMWVV